MAVSCIQPADPVSWFVNYRERFLSMEELVQRDNADYFLMFQDEVQHLLLNPQLIELWGAISLRYETDI